jgi:hypothetical protein
MTATPWRIMADLNFWAGTVVRDVELALTEVHS